MEILIFPQIPYTRMPTYTKLEIQKILIQILVSNKEIAQRSSPCSITEETSLIRELGFDSYMFLEYLMEVEEKLGKQIDYSNISESTIDTVKDFSQFLELQINTD